MRIRLEDKERLRSEEATMKMEIESALSRQRRNMRTNGVVLGSGLDGSYRRRVCRFKRKRRHTVFCRP